MAIYSSLILAKVSLAVTLQPISVTELKQLTQDAKTPYTLVNLWSTWCPPCLEEIPQLLQLAKRQSKQINLVLVSIDVDSQQAKAMTWVEKWQTQAYWRQEEPVSFIEKLEPRLTGVLPALLLYDKTGQVVELWQGDFTLTQVREKIESLDSSLHKKENN